MKATRAGAIVLMVLFISSCDVRPQQTSSGGGADSESHQPAPPAWQDNTITIHDEQVVAALEAAMAEARETADAARLRFDETPETPANDRTKWWVKWEVPIDNAGDPTANEYLWVRPVRWSQFRIEGYLATQPQRESLQSNPGDLVSFPISELADWVYLLDGSMTGARQGGYTIDVLEDHFGTPEPGDDE